MFDITYKCECNVDSGLILITDADRYKAEGAEISDNQSDYKEILLENNGLYSVSAKVKMYGNDKEIQKEASVLVTSGKLIVGDPCYHFKNDRLWNEFLKNFIFDEKNIHEFKESVPNSLLLHEIPGDGKYEIFLKTRKIMDL